MNVYVCLHVYVCKPPKTLMGLEGTVPDSKTGLEIELVSTNQKEKFHGTLTGHWIKYQGRSYLISEEKLILPEELVWLT